MDNLLYSISIFFMIMLVFILIGIRKAEGIFRKKDYTPVKQLDQQCWVRSLKELEKIQSDPTITKACMTLGAFRQGGHAWISYIKDGYVINYDPSLDKVVSKKKYKGR